MKHHYRLIAIDLSRQKELDDDPKTIQQIEFGRQLKNVDGINADGAESMFILTILDENQRREIKIFSRNCNSISNNGKLSRSKSLTNKYTTKQIKICSRN